MKSTLNTKIVPTVMTTCVAGLLFLSSGAALAGAMNHEGMNHGSMDMGHMNMDGMDHGSTDMDDMKMPSGQEAMQHGDDSHGGEHHASAAGDPGDPDEVDRTIEVTAHDAMRFKPDSLSVKQGATIRFVLTNVGQIRHEFVIGTADEVREHKQTMQQMPNMVHEDRNSLSLEPGQAKSLVWQFTNPGVVQIACLVPGHYAAGMVGTVRVTAVN